MNKTEAYNRMNAILVKARAEGRGLHENERDEFDRLEVEFRAAGVPETRGTGSGGRTEAVTC